MSGLCSRKPFDLPSGCETISVPTLMLPSVCSLPSLTSPGVSPNPVVFNIPELPNVPVEQACIDITPVFSARVSKKDGSPSMTGSFRTASGYDDCLEGRYNLGIKLNIPCILDRIPASAKSLGKWSSSENVPEIGMKFIKPGAAARSVEPTCTFDRISFDLKVPCPITGVSVSAVQKTYSNMSRPRIKLKMPKKNEKGECKIDISKVSLQLNIPAGCEGMTFTSPPSKVGIRHKNTEPSVHVSFKRKSNDRDGSKPEVCNFEMGLNLQIPPGCHKASYYVAPKVTKNSSPSIYAKVTKLKGREDECAFNLSFALGLPTAALSPCLKINVSGVANDDDPNRKFASLKGEMIRPPKNPDNKSPCDLDLSLDLHLPRIIIDGEVNINMGNGDINVNNGININNNNRFLFIDLKLPSFICMPKEVLTISRVQMKFFKDSDIKPRYWRHVSVSKATCVKKKVRKYPGEKSINPQYTMTCVTQCSRTVNVSMKLPWWMYRGNTKNNGKRTIEYIRAKFLRDIARRGVRAPGDGGPDDQNGDGNEVVQPRCDNYMGRISIRASLNDFETDPGSADISVWMTLPCPGDTISMYAGSGLHVSEYRGTCCSVVFWVSMGESGVNTCVTRYASFQLRNSGFWAKEYIDCFRRGVLCSIKNNGPKKLFAAKGCN